MPVLQERDGLNRVIRARPDLVYLEIGPIVAAVRDAADHPILLQRGDTIDRHNNNRSSMMIDWFMVAPAGNDSDVTHARRFFRGSLLGYIEHSCDKGRPAAAFNHAPEIEWMRWPHARLLPWSVRRLPIAMRNAKNCTCGQFASPYAEECESACEVAAPVPNDRKCTGEG